MAGPPYQGGRRLLRGLRHEREGRARRGVLPPGHVRAGPDQAALVVPQDEARRPAPVWDPLVRIGHWTLAVGIAAAWLTKEGSGRLHEWIGYATLALVVIRIAWGFVGPRYARF